MSDGAEIPPTEFTVAEEAPALPQPAAEAAALPPADAGSRPAKANERLGNMTADAEQRRRRQALELQRERVLSERTSNPHRRSALESALIDIEEKLAELGWTIHL